MPRWLQLTRYNTRGYTDTQIDRIARLCAEAEVRGDKPYPSVWHMAAIVGGHACLCVNCRAGGYSDSPVNPAARSA